MSITTTTKEIRAYNKDDGKFLWQSNISASMEQHGDITLVRVYENGRGIWGGKDIRQWRATNIYNLIKGKITPVRSRIDFYEMNNVPVNIQEKTYDTEDHKVYVTKNGEKRSFDMEDDLIDKEILGNCLMYYPFDRSGDLEFHMMTNEPAHYKMTMVNLGIDTLKYGDKAIQCYKLQMIPDLGFLGVFAPFVPKTYFWYRAEPPHDFIRYEGLESGLNTPYIVMESVNR